MQRKKITSYEYTLTEDEFKCFTRALVYVRHRILEHDSYGAKTVGSWKYIVDMLSNIEKV
jgi:hypothetical protein